MLTSFRSPLEFPSKKSLTKRGDFGIVNIVQEATPILPDDEPLVSASKLDSSEEPTVTEHLAEQTAQMLDEIRK